MSSFVDHVVEPVDAGFVELLCEFVNDAHDWKKTHGEFPNPDEVRQMVGVRKTILFEQSMSQLAKDFETFFPARLLERCRRVFRSLRRHRGFGRTGQVIRLAQAAEAGGVSLDSLVTAETDLMRRLGWPVKATSLDQRRDGASFDTRMLPKRTMEPTSGASATTAVTPAAYRVIVRQLQEVTTIRPNVARETLDRVVGSLKHRYGGLKCELIAA